MKEGILLYFSEEEFALMMELAGGKEYSLFLSAPEPDTFRLTAAFANLFRRGLLNRQNNTFVLSESGAFFKQLRKASRIVLLRKKGLNAKTLLFYVQQQTLWLAELLGGNPQERYRISLQRSDRIGKWLLDMQLLPQPTLRDADTKELELLLTKDLGQKPSGERLVQIEQYSGAGECLCNYTLWDEKIGLLLQRTVKKQTQICFYTQDTLQELLRRCFGG